MAAKMILKDAKAPLHLIRSSFLSSVRLKTAPSHGEFAQALRIATQMPISEAPVIRRQLFAECSLSSQGVTGVGPIWAAGNSVIEARNRGSKNPFINDDDDFYGYKDSDGSDIDYDIGSSDDDDGGVDMDFDDDEDEDEEGVGKKGKKRK